MNPPFHPPRKGRTARQDAVQARILDEAVRLFAEHGFEQTRVADIAQAAEVAKGSILYHYHSKENLWKAALEKAVADFEALLVGQPSDPTFEGFMASQRLFMFACAKEPAYFRISALETMAENWRSQWIGTRHLRRHMAMVHDWIRRLQDAGALAPIDPLVIQAMVFGGYQLLVGQSAMIKAAADRDVTAMEFVETYLDGVSALFTVPAKTARF